MEIIRKLKPLYSLSYLYTIKDDYVESLKNRLIYYDEYCEKKIFERIYICLEIIKKCGFNEIFDLNKVEINEEFLFNDIIKLKQKITLLFNIRELANINGLMRYINIIFRRTFLICIQKDNQNMFYIDGLKI